jgi:hypothetical protein
MKSSTKVKEIAGSFDKSLVEIFSPLSEGKMVMNE